MSWNQWNTGMANAASIPNSQVVGSSIPSQNASNQIPYNPAVLPPGNSFPTQFSGMTPEQQFAMQQNWQQWQSYQQQYAQWHAQYGEQYKREMEVKLGAAPPSLPMTPNVPSVGNISQYSQIVPAAPGGIFAAPPPPPENDIKKPTNVNSDQPPPPPPPPPSESSNDEEKRSGASLFSKQTEIDKNYSHNFNNNYAENKQVFSSNQRQTSTLEFDNKMINYQYQQNYDDRRIQKSSDTPQQSNQSYNSTQNNNKGSENTSAVESKSREEKVFDEQFRKWEEEFENWKKANVNHPDKKAYREYEMKFEDCRRKLIERREQMRRKKIQQEQQANQEQQARHDQQIRELKIREEHIRQEQQIREEHIRQEQQRQKDEETKQEQQKVRQDHQIIEEQIKEPSQLLVNKIVIEPKCTDEIEKAKFEEKEDIKLTDDEIAVKSDFLETDKRQFGIPGLDLVQTDSPKEIFEHSNIIDLERSDVCDASRHNMWDKNINQKVKIEKSRWSNSNEQNKEILQKDWNFDQYERTPENYVKKVEFPDNDIRPTQNKIPSLFDQKIEKPTFSPPNEKSESFEFPKCDNAIGTNAKNDSTSAPIEDESNNMQNLANALSNPNVMALLSAALQKNDQIPIDNKDISLQEENLDKRNDDYNSDRDNPFFRTKFGGEGIGNQNESYNSNQANQLYRNRFDGGNKFGGNRNNHNITIWDQDNRNDNWRNQNNSDFNTDNNDFEPNWNNQQNLRQDPQSHRNPFNALNRGSPGEFNNFEDTGGNRNIFDNNRGRDRDREWNQGGRNNRNKNNNRRNSNQNNRNNSNDRSSSSSKDNNNFDQNTKSGGGNINPFKTDLPMASKSPNFKQQQLKEEENYFRPAHVIDYQNKPLSEVVNTIQKEIDTIQPKKIVDYGHKAQVIKNVSTKIETESFFPMKTIDYGHASNKTDLETVKPKQSFGDFLANRTNNQKRKADDDDVRGEFDKKNKITIVERNNNSEYADKWTLKNIESRQTLSFPTKSENRKNIIKNILNNVNDCKMEKNDLFLNEHFDAVSDVENDFDESNLIFSNDDKYFKEDSLKSAVDKLINIIPENLSQNNSNNNINKIKPNESIMHTVENISENNNQISIPTFQNNNTILIDEIILNPGRMSRPQKIVIILRGPPGSGKSYIAKLIKDKEIELNGSAPRLLSIDDYFMIEIDREEKCPNTGRKVIRKVLVYEYDNVMESKYFEYLMKSFKKTLLEQQYNFIIVDCVNNSLRTFTEFYNLAKLSNYTPYTIDLHCNLDKCLKQNNHNRSEQDITNILQNWNNTPSHYIKLDVTNIVTRFNSPDIHQLIVEKDNEVCNLQSYNSDSHDSYDTCVKTDFMKCKWDVDTSQANLARLDGTRKNFQNKTTLEDYLQMDGWEPPASNSNKKRVRWADIEEKREQDKMRAIGFVVGQTDWNRMLDPTGGSSALTKTKFIEKLSRKK